MHRIKKYANRKLYDATTKEYVTMDEIAELVRAGEDVRITDNTNGEDITQEIASQLVGRVFDGQARKLPPAVLMQLLRRGSGGIVDYTRKYLSFWQNALNFAEDELDKVDTFIGRDKPDASVKGEKDPKKDRKDDRAEVGSMIQLLDERIERRLEDALRDRDSDLKEQLTRLSSDVVQLGARIAAFETVFAKVLKTEEEAATGSAPKTKKAGSRP
jgi:polyhydroxyalkanoate synthesis repressor PhaR